MYMCIYVTKIALGHDIVPIPVQIHTAWTERDPD